MRAHCTARRAQQLVDKLAALTASEENRAEVQGFSDDIENMCETSARLGGGPTCKFVGSTTGADEPLTFVAPVRPVRGG